MRAQNFPVMKVSGNEDGGCSVSGLVYHKPEVLILDYRSGSPGGLVQTISGSHP